MNSSLYIETSFTLQAQQSVLIEIKTKGGRNMPDMTIVQRVAESQYVFGILFIFLFLAATVAGTWLCKNLLKENDEREQKIIEMHEKRERDLLNINFDYRKESQGREKKLLEHLEKTTQVQTEMSRTIERVQGILSALELSVKEARLEISYLKKGAGHK